MKYSEMSRADLQKEKQILENKYKEYCSMGLALDLSRGKPNSEQLDVSEGFYRLSMEKPLCMSGNMDCRNYGVLEGLPEMRAFFANLLSIVLVLCLFF